MVEKACEELENWHQLVKSIMIKTVLANIHWKEVPYGCESHMSVMQCR